ncbi:MAG: hypothetical protein IBX45_11115 [Campylobacterales bacterium]|nr:hypothetical protein [Campylobacterales bacterium]
MRHILREVVFFFGLFGILALGMHMDRWLSAPLTHLANLGSHTMPWHPIVYTFVLYAVLVIIRFVLSLAVRPFRRA